VIAVSVVLSPAAVTSDICISLRTVDGTVCSVCLTSLSFGVAEEMCPI